MASRSKLELVAWATACASTWESFWYSRLGETHSLRREYQISSTVDACQHTDSSRGKHSTDSYHAKHQKITKNTKQSWKTYNIH